MADYLLEHGLLDASGIARAEEVSTRAGSGLPQALSRLGMVADHEIAQALASVTGLPMITKAEFAERPVEIDGLNARYLERRAAIPVAISDGRLRVAMADPQDTEAVAALEFASGLAVSPVIANFSDIEEALTALRPAADDDAMASLGRSDGTDEDIARLLDSGSEAPVIRLVQRLLVDAIKLRASDVHIEPMARHVAVRYRVDGRLHEVERHPSDWADPIASRIKIMAGLDIAETRLPQDGRLRLTVRGRDVDVRVSTSPIAHGESIVLRLLGRSEVPLDLEQLGLPAASLARLVAALDRPHGIVLLTGPTGSGKTTTLYAAINRLRRPEVKILTVEDPVEVLLEGINQVQVRPEIDLSYAATLRAFLRQDPDILMIGEIRDGETAEIALRAALTGHLVLSTLHTNSALGAFTRLADIGIEPYLASSTVIATAAQRLIRALCPHCRTPREPSPDEVRLFDQEGLDVPSRVHDAGGCAACQQTGYRGRLPLIEVVTIDDALRQAIRAGTVESFRPSLGPGETLFGHGLSVVADGRTSLAEVRRAIQLQ